MMNLDVAHHLGAVLRTASLQEDGKTTVSLERTFSESAVEVWQALTNSERLSRWFTPVTGDLKLHGRYQLEGNAGGEIIACMPVEHFGLTWEFGGDLSWVDVRLFAAESGGTRLSLTHTAQVSDHWTEYGPSATGIGWELSLLGLALHLAQPTAEKLDETALATSPDGKALIAGSGDAWAQAAIHGGEDPEASRAAAQRTVGFYTGAS